METTNQSYKVNEERTILVQPYRRGFNKKEEAIQQIRKISSYLDTVNVWNTSKLNFLSEKEFIRVLENGIPHRLGSCLGSKMSPRNVQDYRTNIFCFDIDHLEHLPKKITRRVIALLNQHFHYVQESFSSGKNLAQRRFHCYLIVTTLQVDYEVLALIYKQVRDDLSAKIGISFDESMYPLKNIFSSGKKVRVNRLKVFDLKPYLESYLEKKKRLIGRKGHEIKDYEVVNDIVDKQFNTRFTTSRVNFDELLKAIRSEIMPSISDYEEWIRYLMAFNDMEREGLITSSQKFELAEAIDDGKQGYVEEFEKLKKYDEVTIGSLIYRLQQNGIQTNHIFNISERYELRTDLSLDIQGKITDNPTVVNTLNEILYNKENRGKRILLIGGTGTGKSTAILEILKNMTDVRIQYNSTQGFSILCIPRLNLINNLRGRFENIPTSNTVTGSTKFPSGNREKVIQDSYNILTTLDHSPFVVQLKLDEQKLLKVPREKHEMFSNIPMLMVLDECHMLSTDATFKPEAIIEYCETEKAFLNAGGVSLHITATPENLRSEDYDLIIRINELNRENPFEQAGYLMLDGSSKQVERKMLEIIKVAVKKNPDRKLLLFIENKETIFDFIRELKKVNIETAGVVSKKEEFRSSEEKLIVCDGIIPDKVQVILATTALSAGVSIENNSKVDETWILCSAGSLNHEMTRIVQMSHRFRNKYHALKLFFQKPKKQEKKKVFLYHTFLDEEFKKAEGFKMAIEMIREKQLEGRITLDELERQNGLFADEEGTLHVCSPLIQSEIVLHKTYYNYNNPDDLILELEKKFRCRFPEMTVNEVIEVPTCNEAKTIRQTKPSIETLKSIVDDESIFNQLKNEFFIVGKSHFRAKMKKQIKLSTVKDLEYLFESGCDFANASQILKNHIRAKKDETVSYRKDKRALESMKKILNSKDNSLSVRMFREISKQLSLLELTENQLEFAKIKDLESYLKLVANEILKDVGFNFGPEKVESFKDLLKIEKKKSGKVRKYTVVGFVDETYIKEKYGIERIV